jgi:hypothetical protein
MKLHLCIGATLLSMGLLSGCATSGQNVPSLSGNTRPTEATPSPSNYRGNAITNASTMTTPQARTGY